MSAPTINEIAEKAVADRQDKARTYLAGMTEAGLALCIDRTDLHYQFDTMGRNFIDMTSAGGWLPMGSYHLVNDAIWVNPKASFVHAGPFGRSCLQAQVEYAQAISERFPLVDGEPQQVWMTSGGRQAQLVAENLAQEVNMHWGNIKILDPSTYAPLDTGQAQKLCRISAERGSMTIVDERLTAYGRFGCFRAAERYDLDQFAPSLITVLGEAGGGGIPWGAVVAPKKVFDHYPKWNIAERTGGNPIACAAGLRILELQNGEFYEHVRDMTYEFEDCCNQLAGQFPEIVLRHDGRGMNRSLYIAAYIDMSLLHQCLLNAGVITDVRWDHLLLTPPLIMTEAAMRQAFDQFAVAVVEVSKMCKKP